MPIKPRTTVDGVNLIKGKRSMRIIFEADIQGEKKIVTVIIWIIKNCRTYRGVLTVFGGEPQALPDRMRYPIVLKYLASFKYKEFNIDMLDGGIGTLEHIYHTGEKHPNWANFLGHSGFMRGN